jgi:hypothetical protein
VNLMDALRKSVGNVGADEAPAAAARAEKKAGKGAAKQTAAKEAAAGISLVQPAAKAPRRKKSA